MSGRSICKCSTELVLCPDPTTTEIRWEHLNQIDFAAQVHSLYLRVHWLHLKVQHMITSCLLCTNVNFCWDNKKLYVGLNLYFTQYVVFILKKKRSFWGKWRGATNHTRGKKTKSSSGRAIILCILLLEAELSYYRVQIADSLHFQQHRIHTASCNYCHVTSE